MPSPDPSAGQIAQKAGCGSAGKHCPLHRYLMDYVGFMTEAAAGPANRDATRYRAIGHYTFPDDRFNPRRRANMGA
jgi:hypothetical protein